MDDVTLRGIGITKQYDIVICGREKEEQISSVLFGILPSFDFALSDEGFVLLLHEFAAESNSEVV